MYIQLAIDCCRCGVGQVIAPVDYYLNDMITSAADKAGYGVFNHGFSTAVSMFLAQFIAQTNAAQVVAELFVSCAPCLRL